MPEFLYRESLSARKLLETCEIRVLENGSVLLTSLTHLDHPYDGQEDQPFQLATSVMGRNLMNGGKDLTKLLDQDVKESWFKRVYWGTDFATKENAGTFFNPYFVAVKRVTPNGVRITGLEQFEALTVLKEKGVLCVTPLVATRDRFISRWLGGSKVPDKYIDQLIDYEFYLRDIVKILEQEGKWKRHWGIDNSCKNYRVNNPKSQNILDWFITFDPVAFSFNSHR